MKGLVVAKTLEASAFHRQAALDHRAAAELHLQAASQHEQNNKEDAEVIAKSALERSVKAHWKSVTAIQGWTK
jgi:hypothetical protein